jgi:hypothetical protein
MQAFPRVCFFGAFCREKCDHVLSSFLITPPLACSDDLCSDMGAPRRSENYLFYIFPYLSILFLMDVFIHAEYGNSRDITVGVKLAFALVNVWVGIA